MRFLDATPFFMKVNKLKKKWLLKSQLHRAGEMTKLLRALTALAEDQSSVLSTHMAVPNHSYLKFKGIPHLLLTSLGTKHSFINAGEHSYMQIKNKYIFKKRNQLWGLTECIS